RLLVIIPTDVRRLPHDGRIDPLWRRGNHPLRLFLYPDYPYPTLYRGYPVCADHVRTWAIGRFRTASEAGALYLSPLAVRRRYRCGGIPHDFTILHVNP